MAKYLISIIFSVLTSCGEKSQETTILTAANTKYNLKAVIIERNNGNLFDSEYYLQIYNTSDSVYYRLSYDLLEGRGGYESGLVKFEWISENELFIERFLDDRRQNLIYNLSEISFTNIIDSIPNINDN